MGTEQPERRIHVLSDHVANQIAAGEVVERPAAVVKELVENALDAGATRVRVEIEDGGKRLIRIIDNGCGMSAPDALTALLRHATSKVESADDLRSIGTLGFRGEALPSIQSVSRFSVRTRPHEALEGVRIVAEGALDPVSEPAGGPPGTEVVVRDLFFNVPARRKFLRRTGTEMSRISTLVDQVALGWPGVHFSLIHNGRRTAEYPADSDLRARVLAVLGRDVCLRLHPVRLEMGQHLVHGYVSEPTLHRPNARGMFTYVNGRFVRDRVLQHAITRAYGSMLESGRYPIAVLFLALPPEAVDVNVHPAKAEVRFVESGAVHSLIERALRLTLADAPWGQPGAGEGPVGDLARTTSPTPPGAMPLFGPGLGADDIPDFSAGEGRPIAAGWAPDRSGEAAAPPTPTSTDGPAPDGPEADGFFARLHYLGQANRCFLVCQSPGSLHVIDQHAAHERVVYERLHSAWRSRSGVQTQRLLFPVPLQLEPALARAAEQHGAALRRMGFDCEHFGGRDWVVAEIPAQLVERDPVTTLVDVLAQLADLGAADAVETRIEALLATMACHAAVRAGDDMKPEEVRALLQQMDGVPLRANCPHGRPVLASFSFGEVARWFHRT